jgi:hypothetical protein
MTEKFSLYSTAGMSIREMFRIMLVEGLTAAEFNDLLERVKLDSFVWQEMVAREQHKKRDYLVYAQTAETMTWDEAAAWTKEIGLKLPTEEEIKALELPGGFYWLSNKPVFGDTAFYFDTIKKQARMCHKEDSLGTVAIRSKISDVTGNPSY